MLAAEGLFAVALPLVVGPWSDTFHTALGRRRPFMLVALGPLGFCLALMAFMPSIWTTALIVFAFFFAYLSAKRGYQALWPILGLPVLLAIPLVARLGAAERQAGAGQPESPEPIV